MGSENQEYQQLQKHFYYQQLSCNFEKKNLYLIQVEMPAPAIVIMFLTFPLLI
jgi:hypothetical protein